MINASGKQFLDANAILRASDVRSGHSVVDAQCGHLGHCSIPASQLVGPEGRVYAVDVRRLALDSLQSRARMAGVGSVYPVRGDIGRSNGVPLDNDIADVVLLVNTLSRTENPLEVVREAVRLLKSGGSLAVVDWHPYGSTYIGPHARQRISEMEARSTCLVSGLEYEGPFEAGEKHYGFICKAV